MKTYIIRGSRHVQTRRFLSLHKGLADGMIKKKKKTPAGPPIRHPLDGRYICTYVHVGGVHPAEWGRESYINTGTYRVCGDRVA